MRAVPGLRIAPFLPIFLALLMSAAHAESMKGVVVDLDPAARSIALFRNDTSKEPRQLKVRLTPDAKLTGVGSIGDLHKGSEIQVRTKGEDLEALEAEYLELIGSSEETQLNLRSVTLYGNQGSEASPRRFKPIHHRTAAGPSAAVQGPEAGSETRRPPEPRDTETDWYLGRADRVPFPSQYRSERDQD